MGVRNKGQRRFPGRPGSLAEPVNEPLLYRFYYQMTFIRQFEEQCLVAHGHCPWLSRPAPAMGLEVCDVGLINALDRTRDFIFSTHRAHGHFIAYSNDVAGLAQASTGGSDMGRVESGDNRHLCRFHTCARGGEGGLVHKALDMAFACRRQAAGAICAVFLDRGTVSQPVLKEFGNICSLWSLPILFVLTHNGLLPKMGRRRGRRVDEMATPFACASQCIVADDVFKVYAFASAAVAYVRNNCGPFLLRLQTDYAGTYQDGGDVRPEDQGNERPDKDPLQKIAGLLTPQAREIIESLVQERIREAVEGA